MAITKEQARPGTKVKIPTTKTDSTHAYPFESFKEELDKRGLAPDFLIIESASMNGLDAFLAYPGEFNENLGASRFSLNDLVLYETEAQPDSDPTNPSHYNGREVFDQMLALYGAEAVRHFCLLNSFKYRMRAGKKANTPASQDLDKALWYERALSELPK